MQYILPNLSDKNLHDKFQFGIKAINSFTRHFITWINRSAGWPVGNSCSSIFSGIVGVMCSAWRTTTGVVQPLVSDWISERGRCTSTHYTLSLYAYGSFGINEVAGQNGIPAVAIVTLRTRGGKLKLFGDPQAHLQHIERLCGGKSAHSALKKSKKKNLEMDLTCPFPEPSFRQQ